MITISKTDYLIFRECKKNAWLKIHRPEVFYRSKLSEFDKAIIETGNEVESYARKLFPAGVMIEGRDRKALDETQVHIAKRTPVLFQPVFLNAGFLAALDILQYDPSAKGYVLYEVKSSNEIKEDTHLRDLAFQCVLLGEVGIDVRKALIIHLNSDYVRAGELDLNNLLTIEDVTDVVRKLQAHTAAEMEMAQQYLSQEKEPPGGHCNCIYKGRSRHCSTFHHSNPDVPEYGVHDIARIGSSKAKLAELADAGIFRLEDLPDSLELTKIQQNQVDAYIQDRVLIDKDKVAEELKKMVYPLYFLDYETCPAAIPRFDGFSPYQQIPFQYSLHILDHPSGTPRHKEFLSLTPGDPSAALYTAIKGHVGKSGSVVVWSKKFECTINKELRERMPSAKAFLDSLNSRVYDLMDVFSKQYHVHKGFKGGTSIKDILPVLAPELSYEDLAIQEGGAASQSWDKITSGTTSQSEKDRIARDLKAYCERDTYAMYRIWRELCAAIPR